MYLLEFTICFFLIILCHKFKLLFSIGHGHMLRAFCIFSRKLLPLRMHLIGFLKSSQKKATVMGVCVVIILT